MSRFKEDCFAYRGNINADNFCDALTNVSSCRACKFYKKWSKYIADLRAAEERNKKISGVKSSK